MTTETNSSAMMTKRLRVGCCAVTVMFCGEMSVLLLWIAASPNSSAPRVSSQQTSSAREDHLCHLCTTLRCGRTVPRSRCQCSFFGLPPRQTVARREYRVNKRLRPARITCVTFVLRFAAVEQFLDLDVSAPSLDCRLAKQ